MKGLEETKLAGHTVLLLVHSLLLEQWVHLEIVGACAYNKAGTGWPGQSFSYLGFFLAHCLGAAACQAAGCGTFQCPQWHGGSVLATFQRRSLHPAG